jgi:hypothetical protein
MRTYKINSEVAKDIKGTIENNDYIVWADGSEITENELMNEFILEESRMRNHLKHKREDFRIDDIVLSNNHYDLEEN